MNSMESITVELDIDDVGLLINLLVAVSSEYKDPSNLHFQALMKFNTALQEALDKLSFQPEQFEHF